MLSRSPSPASPRWTIRADTRPRRQEPTGDQGAIARWGTELVAGFRVVRNIPLLWWSCVIFMGLNFFLAPMGVVLPVLVKEGRGLPPWFLGALESSISVGAIVGAVVVGTLCRLLKPDVVVVGGLAMIGAGIGLIAWVPSVLLPLSMMFLIGLGVTVAQIPLSTQRALAIPDGFRSRLGSTILFLSSLAYPLGLGLAGWCIEAHGLHLTLVVIAGVLLLASPALFLIPDFVSFHRLPPEEAQGYFGRTYPAVFEER